MLREAEKRIERDRKPAGAAQAHGHALHRTAILPYAGIALVLARRIGIEPARSRVLDELADVVDLGEHAGRALRVGLVVGDLERERALARRQHAVARERPAVEVEPGEDEAPAPERLAEHFRDETAVVFAAAQRRARPALPAARLEAHELLQPCADVVAG